MYNLTLNTIGAWQLRNLVPDCAPNPQWVATLPSLQRDAVWKPGQVELLWDSIFRGFPIGSLVVSEILANQKSRHGKLAGNQDPWPEPEINKRHLLDGQQRSNAITLGFFDPFAPEFGTNPSQTVGSILWLDISPDSEVFTSDSTRHFLFRLTTRAHPWGYETRDSAGRLQAFEMQESIRVLKEECAWKPAEDDPYQRPAAIDLWPVKATVPIPAAWLLIDAFRGKRSGELWTALRERCESARHLRWARKAAEWIANASSSQLTEIEKGLDRARHANVVVLEVPAETIRAKSRQEAGDTDFGNQSLSNVEHLFQRLNNGGTPISQEELQYSMIKAYWPGIEETISGLCPLPMRASRLAILGSRAAFATEQPKPDRMPAQMSIAALRVLATDPQRAGKRALVEQFFEIPDNLEQPFLRSEVRHRSLSAVVALIDQWLLQRHEEDNGLPPVLRTAIAHQSPEVYLLLMVLAERVLTEQIEPDAFRTAVIALATSLHWFSSDQHRAVQRIYGLLSREVKLTPEFFTGILRPDTDEPANGGLLELVPPESLAAIIYTPDAEHLHEWNWEQAIIEQPANGDPDKIARLTNTVWPFVCRTLWNKELLIFAQRKWVHSRFKSFDNADASAWEDHNRPWDYDHLLPQSTFYNVHNARYLRATQRWGNTIGNFHILPFEDNRSRGNTDASEAFSKSNLDLMLVQPDELDAFSLNREDVRNNTDRVLRFVQATRRRILSIYEDWYCSLEVDRLLNLRGVD